MADIEDSSMLGFEIVAQVEVRDERPTDSDDALATAQGTSGDTGPADAPWLTKAVVDLGPLVAGLTDCGYCDGHCGSCLADARALILAVRPAIAKAAAAEIEAKRRSEASFTDGRDITKGRLSALAEARDQVAEFGSALL